MNQKRAFILKFIFLMLLAVIFFTPTNAKADSTFKFKNMLTKEWITYTGRTPSYIIDGTVYDNSTEPAIILDGYALAPMSVFSEGMGIDCQYDSTSKRITLKYYDQTLIMYAGKTIGFLNGEEIVVPLEPLRIKYKNTQEYTCLLPSRFVTETLGMVYTWHQDNSTIDVTTPMPLVINGKLTLYNGSLGGIYYNDSKVNNSSVPSYIFNDNAMICLKVIAKKIDGFTYYFNEEDDSLEINYKDYTINMTMNDTVCYVNGLIEYAPEAPQYIYNKKYKTHRVYVPARFVFETLGFNYEWESKSSKIKEKDNTGIYIANYDDILIYNITSKNASSTEKNSGSDTLSATENNLEYTFRQVLDFPILEGIRTDLLVFKEDLYNNKISFNLTGNYIDFYKKHVPVNTGEAVLQIQIIYYEPEDITKVVFCTRTNEEQIILSHKDAFYSDHIEITFDRPGNLFDKIIVLDPGHGGPKPGTIHGGYNEKDVNLSLIINYCKPLFDASDIKVFYTRTDDSDVDLSPRAELAGRVDADLFISVHQNSLYTTSLGTEVYYSKKNEGNYNGLTSDVMAQMFFDNLVNALGSVPRWVKGERNYVVVSEQNAAPAVLLEIGYMSNPEELVNLVDGEYQKKAGQAIYNTVLQIYKQYYNQ